MHGATIKVHTYVCKTLFIQYTGLVFTRLLHPVISLGDVLCGSLVETLKLLALRFGSIFGLGLLRCPLAMTVSPRWNILLEVENQRYRVFILKKTSLSKSRPGSFPYFYVTGHFMSLQKSKPLNYLSQIYPICTLFYLFKEIT
jgi:hypothetical protein